MNITQEQKEAVRELWLSEYGYCEEDVNVDAAGKEYITIYEEEGILSQDKYLPDHLQSQYVIF